MNNIFNVTLAYFVTMLLFLAGCSSEGVSASMFEDRSEIDESSIVSSVVALNLKVSDQVITEKVFDSEIALILFDLGLQAAKESRNPLIFSDIAFTCMSSLDRNRSFVEPCKNLYRLAITTANKNSDTAALVNAAPMLQAIGDDDSVRWLLGLGLATDREVARWSIDEVGRMIKVEAKRDAKRARFIYSNLARYCEDEKLARHGQDVQQHCSEVLTAVNFPVEQRAVSD